MPSCHLKITVRAQKNSTVRYWIDDSTLNNERNTQFIAPRASPTDVLLVLVVLLATNSSSSTRTLGLGLASSCPNSY